MRVLLACGMLVIAGIAGGAPAPPAASHPTLRRTTARVGPSTPRPVAPVPQPVQTAARRPGKTVPAALGGPAKYDAKKGAMLGGTVMPHRP